MELIKIACEMPEKAGRSLCLWDCTELAEELQRRGVVEKISTQSVQRILRSCKLKPWRCHPWLNHKAPRDNDFIDRTHAICDIYTRPLAQNEVVLSIDEKTSLQPRTRLSPTKPALPQRSVQVEHEYERKGATNLFAAIDTRTGRVIGQSFERKRQIEFIQFLETINASFPLTIVFIHIVCDNLKVHSGKLVQEWLQSHQRFVFHFTPVHCSWMNQVEQWFGILQRKLFKVTNFRSLPDLKTAIDTFIVQWNQKAEPFKWTTKSFEKILAKAESAMKKAA